jgi:hypothetical protein
MQCASCHFENMPGVDACGRCGSSLRLATAVIDVHPPRAGPWAKTVRRWVPWRRVWVRVRDVAVQFRRELAERLDVQLPRREVLGRMIVPGWNQLHAGLKLRGWFFLGAYLVLMPLALLFLGTALGNILLGLAIAVHAGSSIDVVWADLGGEIPKPVTAGLILLMLGGIVYLPAGWLLTSVAYPLPMQNVGAPLEAGDVFLSNRWAYRNTLPQPGDMVEYHFQGMRLPGMIVPAGANIDRVLAGPGSRVRWDKGTLWVDDEPVAWRPLNPERLPAQLAVDVPAEHYFVLPTLITYLSSQTSAEQWRLLGLIRAEQIAGRVYLRHQPLSRWWLVR